MPTMQSLSRKKADFLRILAARIVPETTQLDAAGSGLFFDIIDAALMDRPGTVRRQFAKFLGLIRSAPLIRYGRSFEKLPVDRQDAVLRWFQDCPVGVFRTGFWGLKAMVFMGYYGQPETNELIGYAPELNGGAHLHA
jgi:hypothetical protein